MRKGYTTPTSGVLRSAATHPHRTHVQQAKGVTTSAKSHDIAILQPGGSGDSDGSNPTHGGHRFP